MSISVTSAVDDVLAAALRSLHQCFGCVLWNWLQITLLFSNTNITLVSNTALDLVKVCKIYRDRLWFDDTYMYVTSPGQCSLYSTYALGIVISGHRESILLQMKMYLLLIPQTSIDFGPFLSLLLPFSFFSLYCHSLYCPTLVCSFGLSLSFSLFIFLYGFFSQFV